MQSPEIRTNVLARAGVTCIIALLLLIPLQMVAGLIEEREIRQKEAVGEVNSHWGAAQQITGPFITVPFRNRKNKREKLLYIMPDTLEITGKIVPEKRSRGLYDVMLYRAEELKLSGTFKTSDLPLDDKNLKWHRARVVITLSDTRGIQKGLFLKWNKRRIPFEPGTGGTRLFTHGISAPVGKPAEVKNKLSFSCRLNLRGSTSLSMVPSGRVTRAALYSSWQHPSFFGSFLPAARSVTDKGFNASWSVTSFGSGVPRTWSSGRAPAVSLLKQAAFGVSLFQPVDAYQKITRAVKYGVLFIALTFMVFFLYDLFFSLQLHPLQFVMIGFALCLFFLLFLALSEHIPFTPAYIIASLSITGMIAGYSRAILKNRSRGGVIAGLLSLLYGYLYIVLVSRDYALLLGTVSLASILSIVMYLTRNIDWYQIKNSTE